MIIEGKLVLNKEEENALKSEFSKLKTVKQKFIFWEENFKCSYLQRDKLKLESFQNFFIKTETPEEYEEFNKLVFSDCAQFVETNKKEGTEKWKSKFTTKLNNSSDVEEIVNLEISKINGYILEKSKPEIENYFVLGFESEFSCKKELDWQARRYHPSQLIDFELGVEWAKYSKFVKTCLPVDKGKQTTEFKLTGEQKVLALHYLGFCDEIKIDTQKGIVYEFFIGNFKQKSILKVFSNLSDYETEKNLDTLIDFFRFLNLKSIARKLEDKLANLKK